MDGSWELTGQLGYPVSFRFSETQCPLLEPACIYHVHTHTELGTVAYIYNPSALGKLRQVAHREFEASVDYRLRSYLKQ